MTTGRRNTTDSVLSGSASCFKLGGFRAGVESGELRDDVDYELVIPQVIAMSEGLENQWRIDPEGVDIVACFHDYTRTLRDRLRRIA